MMSLEHNVPPAPSFESSTGPKRCHPIQPHQAVYLYRTPPSASGTKILHMSLVAPIITLLIWLIYFFLIVIQAHRDPGAS